MNGKVCLVTGSSSGLGKDTAMGLAQLGATVILGCRDKQRGEVALAEIKTASGN
jgi:NAD(P)-dependent dehydrogenase (short-subunit alcohol dehydrogenase family)